MLRPRCRDENEIFDARLEEEKREIDGRSETFNRRPDGEGARRGEGQVRGAC